ncbi:MAG: hypothetical protein ACFN4N_02145 [Streptococcus sp.]
MTYIVKALESEDDVKLCESQWYEQYRHREEDADAFKFEYKPYLDIALQGVSSSRDMTTTLCYGIQDERGNYVALIESTQSIRLETAKVLRIIYSPDMAKLFEQDLEVAHATAQEVDELAYFSMVETYLGDESGFKVVKFYGRQAVDESILRNMEDKLSDSQAHLKTSAHGRWLEIAKNEE